MAKLMTPELYDAIVAALAKGDRSQHQIARDLDTSQGQISRVARGVIKRPEASASLPLPVEFERDFEKRPVRGMLRDGEPWFISKDAAEILGYVDTDGAIREVCPRRETHPVTIQGSVSSMVLIPESDLYRLIMKSGMPNAVAFQDWVVCDVLPQIRKTGSYGQPVNGSGTDLAVIKKETDRAIAEIRDGAASDLTVFQCFVERMFDDRLKKEVRECLLEVLTDKWIDRVFFTKEHRRLIFGGVQSNVGVQLRKYGKQHIDPVLERVLGMLEGFQKAVVAPAAKAAEPEPQREASSKDDKDLAAEVPRADLNYIFVTTMLEREGWPDGESTKGVANTFSAELRHFCKERGYPFYKDKKNGVFKFDLVTIERWLSSGGRERIKEELAKRQTASNTEGVLPFPKTKNA